MGKLLHSQSYSTSLNVGTSSVSKIYAGTSQVWPATGFYDCGYGCQYYTSTPACTTCSPTATNVLHGLYISTSNLNLDYYVTLSNNYSSISKNYKLRFSNTTRSTGPISTLTLTVSGYTIDSFFSGTTTSFSASNVIGDTFTVQLSDDNGVTWTASLTSVLPLTLNYIH